VALEESQTFFEVVQPGIHGSKMPPGGGGASRCQAHMNITTAGGRLTGFDSGQPAFL
jgi:hypothetical protein